jgi:hypothetical protein
MLYNVVEKNRRCSDSHHTLYTEIIGICYIERRCDMKLKTGIKTFYDEDGNKTGVLITMKEFEKLIEELEDLQDILTVYERTSKKSTPIPYEKIRKEMFGDDAKE